CSWPLLSWVPDWLAYACSRSAWRGSSDTTTSTGAVDGAADRRVAPCSCVALPCSVFSCGDACTCVAAPAAVDTRTRISDAASSGRDRRVIMRHILVEDGRNS